VAAPFFDAKNQVSTHKKKRPPIGAAANVK